MCNYYVLCLTIVCNQRNINVRRLIVIATKRSKAKIDPAVAVATANNNKLFGRGRRRLIEFCCFRQRCNDTSWTDGQTIYG